METVNAYYKALDQGAFDAIPFTADFRFKGPMFSFNGPDEFRTALKEMMPMYDRIEPRQTFSNDSQVCVIYDFVTKTPMGTVPMAEWFTLRDNQIAAIELFFDATEFRKIMS